MIRRPSPAVTLFVVLFALSTAISAQKQPVPGEKNRAIQVFDVRDLIAAAPDASERPATKDESPRKPSKLLKEIPLIQFMMRDQEPGSQPHVESELVRLERLAVLLRGFIDPPLLAGEEIKPLGQGTLMALAGDEKLAWIERFLAENRKKLASPLTLQARFISVPAPAFRTVIQPLLDASQEWVDQDSRRGRSKTPGPKKKASGEAQPTRGPLNGQSEKFALLKDTKGMETLLLALLRCPGVNVANAPEISTRTLTRSTLVLGNRISYVRDFDIKIVRKAVIAEPEIGTVIDGRKCEFTPARLGSDRIGVSFQFGISELKRPIPKFTTTLGAAKTPVTIQLPEVRCVSVQSRVELKAEESALFAIRLPNERHMVMLLQAHPTPAGK